MRRREDRQDPAVPRAHDMPLGRFGFPRLSGWGRGALRVTSVAFLPLHEIQFVPGVKFD